ncbi:flavin reductase family protein [Chloroflexota bacterium]
MTKITIEDLSRLNQQYPRTAAIVTAQAKGNKNAMVVAWHTSISSKPPLYGISISPKRFTYQLIVDSKEFGINFLPLEAAELVASVGGSSGQQTDKFERFNIVQDNPAKTAVPILEAAYAAYECKLVDDLSWGDHQLLVGKIVAVQVSEEAFTPEGVLDLNQVSPALYLGHDFYVTADKNSLRHLDREVYGQILKEG